MCASHFARETGAYTEEDKASEWTEMTVSLGDVTYATPENINNEVILPYESCRRSICAKCKVSAVSTERGQVN